MSSNPEPYVSYRPLLFSIAYRMLGSAMEAEDMVQEAFLRFQAVPDEDIQSPKAYLSKIVTRLCLDQLKSARVQRENYIGQWLPEPILTGETPAKTASEHEMISTAFLVILESLSPIERAVFLLREIFEYRYAEIAEILGKSEANCRQLYHRARQYVREHRPRFEPPAGDQERLVKGFLEALETGDVERLTNMLAQEAVIYGDGGGNVPASPRPIAGREAVIRLLLGLKRLLPEDTRAAIAQVNGSPGLLFWSQNRLVGVTTFAFQGSQIQAIFNHVNPEKLAYLDQASR